MYTLADLLSRNDSSDLCICRSMMVGDFPNYTVHLTATKLDKQNGHIMGMVLDDSKPAQCYTGGTLQEAMEGLLADSFHSSDIAPLCDLECDVLDFLLNFSDKHVPEKYMHLVLSRTDSGEFLSSATHVLCVKACYNAPSPAIVDRDPARAISKAIRMAMLEMSRDVYNANTLLHKCKDIVVALGKDKSCDE